MKSPAEVAEGIGASLEKLLGDDARAVELLGGVVNPGVLERLDAAGSHGDVLVASRTVTHPAYPDATVRTPTLVGLTASDADVYESECFGPVAYLISDVGHRRVDRPVPRHRPAARRDDRRRLLHLRRRPRRRARGGPRRRRRAVARTCSAASSSTSRPPTPTSTAPAPTPPPTRPTPTAPTSRRGSGSSSPAATSDRSLRRAPPEVEVRGRPRPSHGDLGAYRVAMTSFLLRDARLVDLDGGGTPDRPVDLRIVDGTVAEVGPGWQPTACPRSTPRVAG